MATVSGRGSSVQETTCCTSLGVACLVATRSQNGSVSDGRVSDARGGSIGTSLASVPCLRWIHCVDSQEVCAFTVPSYKQVCMYLIHG